MTAIWPLSGAKRTWRIYEYTPEIARRYAPGHAGDVEHRLGIVYLRVHPQDFYAVDVRDICATGAKNFRTSG